MSCNLVFLFAFIFTYILYSAGGVVAQEVNPKTVNPFHEAQTAPEKWLNDALFIISSDDRIAPLSMIQLTLSEYQRKEGLRLFTQDLLASWKEKDAQIVHDNCKGQSTVGQLCGLDYDPLFCAQDFPETGLFYHTYRKDKKSETIAVKWERDKEVVAIYNIIKEGDSWKLDGVSCSHGGSFNFSEKDFPLSAVASCYQTAKTQEALDACVYTDLKQEEVKLQAIYDQLMEKISSEGKKALVVAQKTWRAYRDAQCAFNSLGSNGGTIHPFSVASCKIQLTRLQVEVLKGELTCEEGVLTCGRQ